MKKILMVLALCAAAVFTVAPHASADVQNPNNQALPWYIDGAGRVTYIRIPNGTPGTNNQTPCRVELFVQPINQPTVYPVNAVAAGDLLNVALLQAMLHAQNNVTSIPGVPGSQQTTPVSLTLRIDPTGGPQGGPLVNVLRIDFGRTQGQQLLQP